ncbi:MAG TPA: hypothetical protein VGW40_10930 [Allosphingosinicella sp.]|nr:hypothetical protein [Allosphingosinicella sp.]
MPRATTRSTSGAGFAFEDLVAADLLSQFLLDMPIEGIAVPGTHILSQAAAAGWVIDDLVCVGAGEDGAERHLALSCKSNLQVSSHGWPADFISAAWALWRGGEPFRRGSDRISLVTRGRHTGFDTIWSDLKSWCQDADECIALGRIDGSAKHRRVYDSVKSPGAVVGTAPSDADTIALIASLELYPVDFQLSPSTTLANARQRCRMVLVSENLDEAQSLWEVLVARAEAARIGNGIVRLPDLIRELAPRFALKAHPSIASSWTRLQVLSAEHLSGIETKLPNGHVVDRSAVAGRLSAALASSDHPGCVVTGDSGTGKSALVRDLLEREASSATKIWLGAETLSAALCVTGRHRLGLDHDIGPLLERSPGADQVLILDSAERLDATTLARLDALLTDLRERHQAGDWTWRVVIVQQQAGFEDQRQLSTTSLWPRIDVPALSDALVRTALASEPPLTWIANDPEVLPLFSNLRTLGWVVAAASSFRQDQGAGLTSSAAIADRLWARWTAGNAQSQLHRLLVRLAIRDAAFERSFAVSELEGAELAAFDHRSQELPLVKTPRNRIEFQHDLASDWARYQRLKEIAGDIPQWSALAPQPLWIAALRLFGQHLLDQPDQARDGWDHAFSAVSSANDVQAQDLLLDALCLSPGLDRHLAAREELMFADNGALLQRLLHRFLHVATVPSIPAEFMAGDGLRIYLEADMRFPVIARWAPMGRFFERYAEQVGALGAPIASRVCKAWLTSVPAMVGGRSMPLRDIMAKVALENARTVQARSAAQNRFGGDGDTGKLIYTTALAGADDLREEVAAFALEMAQRRPWSDATVARIAQLQEADRAMFAALRREAEPRRRPPPVTFLPTEEELPPWPLGPSGRLIGAFRDAVLHNNGLSTMMRVNPEVASEVLLACIIDDHPIRDFSGSLRIDEELGLDSDHESYPTIFWKSPFFPYFQTNADAALAALKQLLDFAMERWAASAPKAAHIPSVEIVLDNGETKVFPGGANQFGWSQHSSHANGQLFSALDALERWFTLKADAGEDLEPWCERLLAMGSSTAMLGVLVNLGKYRPSLFKGPLKPLARIERLYWWDSGRVEQLNVRFDMFHWYRQGETIMTMARDWLLAPHRRKELREVVRDLVGEDAAFGAELAEAVSAWPVPDEVEGQLVQRVLKSELDPANRETVLDEESGETVSRMAYPADLQADLLAYQAEANAQHMPLNLPRECAQALASGREITDESAQRLADLLPDADAAMPEETDRATMIAAAAATLIVCGSAWLREHQEVAKRAHHVIRATIARVGAAPGRDEFAASDTLSFAAIGALSAALVAENPGEWDAPLATVISGPDRGAMATLMRLAERNRGRLGSAWYRINYLLLLFAALSRLAPGYGEDDLLPLWTRWVAQLRAQPIFGSEATIAIVDPSTIARRVERLLERRRSRTRPDRPFRLSGKARRFAGLSTHILESGFGWLLEREAAEANAREPENHRLLAALWAFEAWRMQGDDDEDADDDEDGEYDTPSGMGYSILQAAPTFVMAAPTDAAVPLWRAILDIGPNGHYAVGQFASSWFLLLFNQPDPDKFMATWKAMLDHAFAADWRSSRRWYRGREMLVKLLGLQSPTELSQAAGILPRLPELFEYYRRWATSDMAGDEDDVGTFCYFLTKEAGRPFRLEGVIWLNEALRATDKFYRGSTGNSLAEAIDTVLNEHPAELAAQPASRDAVIAIVARLVRGQVATAMGLQRRIAALR